MRGTGTPDPRQWWAIGAGWPRRTVIGAAVGGLTGVAVGRAWGSDRGGPAARAEVSSTAATRNRAGTFLHVIAHPDDDLYFMNPEIQRDITAGAAVITVVLTAAEGDGRNVDTADPDRESVPVDYAGYSEARHNGLRAAYARMAGSERQPAWERSTTTLGGAVRVERNRLIDGRRVEFYFVNVRKRPLPGTESSFGLPRLWRSEIDAAPTLPLPDSPVTEEQLITAADLVRCLVELLHRHRPTVVRTLDPDPEHDPGRPGHTVSDHEDHTATAQFMLRALEEYRTQTGSLPVVEHYRAYANRFWPRNLSPAAHARKRAVLLAYAGADGPSFFKPLAGILPGPDGDDLLTGSTAHTTSSSVQPGSRLNARWVPAGVTSTSATAPDRDAGCVGGRAVRTVPGRTWGGPGRSGAENGTRQRRHDGGQHYGNRSIRHRPQPAGDLSQRL